MRTNPRPLLNPHPFWSEPPFSMTRKKCHQNVVKKILFISQAIPTGKLGEAGEEWSQEMGACTYSTSSMLTWASLYLLLCLMWLRWSRVCLQSRRPRFDPWVGKIPWRREWLLLSFEFLRGSIYYSFD